MRGIKKQIESVAAKPVCGGETGDQMAHKAFCDVNLHHEWLWHHWDNNLLTPVRKLFCFTIQETEPSGKAS